MLCLLSVFLAPSNGKTNSVLDKTALIFPMEQEILSSNWWYLVQFFNDSIKCLFLCPFSLPSLACWTVTLSLLPHGPKMALTATGITSTPSMFNTITSTLTMFKVRKW